MPNKYRSGCKPGVPMVRGGCGNNPTIRPPGPGPIRNPYSFYGGGGGGHSVSHYQYDDTDWGDCSEGYGDCQYA